LVVNAADGLTEPYSARAGAIARIGQLLTSDISGYAKGGDADFSKIMEKYKLGEVKWEDLAKDEKKEELFLQDIVVDILAMESLNENARTIIKKFNIKRPEAGKTEK
jgi:hypothetical protein